MSVESLPMAPSCALGEAELLAQVERYRRLGASAKVLERGSLHVVVELSGDVDLRLLHETLAIERACCPFYELAWDADQGRLSISVSEQPHAPALDALIFALGLEAPAAG